MKDYDKKKGYEWNMYYGSDHTTKQKAKMLRAHMTDAEKYLWSFLRGRQLGYKFRRQHSIGIYIADFYCHELKLVIEIDGNFHSEEEQVAWDKSRSHDLARLNIELLRFSNNDVMHKINDVLAKIQERCTDLSNNH